MRKIVLISLLFLVKSGFGQLADDFTDDDLRRNPVWIGSNSGADFITTTGLLQSNSTTLNSTFYISTANTLALNCSWEFWCNLKFNTSGANYTDVYLIADQQDLLATNINGYFLRIGSTDDDICLYKRSGVLSAAVKLIDGVNGITASANNLLKIRVKRTDAGIFELEWDVTGEGSQYVVGGTATDLTYVTTSWFGIYIKQSTASFFQKHFFADLKISLLSADQTPPVLTHVIPVDSLHLDVIFSESLETGSALDAQNYILGNGTRFPIAIDVITGTTYRLTYNIPLQSGNFELTVANVADLSGNKITGGDKVSFFYIKPYIAKYGDIVINELFADPSPSVGLPPAEFVELWNTSTAYILLNGWKYEDLTSGITFGKDTIAPNEHIMLCTKVNEPAFVTLGKTIGLATFPALNNDRDVLKLISKEGLLIDEVAYHDSWYKDELKKQGGYSLERIDPANVCAGIQNWQASNDGSGGTPGRQNSVYKSQMSTTKPALTEAVMLDSVTISVRFNKYIDSASAALPTNYLINNGLGTPESAVPQAPGFTHVILKFGTAIKRGVTHQLTVNNLTDCAGNVIDPQANQATIFFAEQINPGDILISETLFNPRPGGVDFVEIYNRTSHILDLSDLQIANTDSAGIANIKNLTVNRIFMQPGSYWVVTSDPENIKANYYAANEQNFLRVSLPAYKVAAGSVILLSNGQTIDWFDYTEGMHTPLLKEAKGIALERISFARPANEPGNFTSASATAGYATPTYKNSVSEQHSTTEGIKLNSRLFSPDHDGITDVLEINYNFKVPDKMGSINIYDDKGLLQRQLIKNHNLATAGNLTWDGLDDKGRLCKVGIYILVFDVFDLKGKTQQFKLPCILAVKLN